MAKVFFTKVVVVTLKVVVKTVVVVMAKDSVEIVRWSLVKDLATEVTTKVGVMLGWASEIAVVVKTVVSVSLVVLGSFGSGACLV